MYLYTEIEDFLRMLAKLDDSGRERRRRLMNNSEENEIGEEFHIVVVFVAVFDVVKQSCQV